MAQIAKDICAIPATSVPCERLFSAGAEIATDRRSRLGTDKFEYLQILKHHWRHTLQDAANINATYVEEVNLMEYKELLARDVEMSEWDSPGDHVVV